MPLKQEPIPDKEILDFLKTEFKTTPKMSTYLVAFIVSDFKKLTNEHRNYSVYAKPTGYKNGKFALEVGQKLLQELDDFTGISFNDRISKIDQFAIPDLLSEAMENWGVVTYRLKPISIIIIQ